MLITTTTNIEGKNIKDYRGTVFGEAITGIDFVTDYTASFSNWLGGRVDEYEEELSNARADAIKAMIDKAEKIGANALIGVRTNVEAIPCGHNERINSMIAVTVEGTAIIIE